MEAEEESLLIASQVSQASATTSAADSSQTEDATYIPDSDQDSGADTGGNWVCIPVSQLVLLFRLGGRRREARRGLVFLLQDSRPAAPPREVQD